MILVDVYIPAVDATYDFMLDEEAEIEKVIRELVEMISKKMRIEKAEAANFVLCAAEKRLLLQRDNSLAEYGIKDGDRLLLV